jgi:hypothetical protein
VLQKAPTAFATQATKTEAKEARMASVEAKTMDGKVWATVE